MMFFPFILITILYFTCNLNSQVVIASNTDLKTRGELFLQGISQREGVYTLVSGMLIEILHSSDKEDTAKSPNIRDTCKVTYTGTFMDGSKFDSGTTNFAPNQVIKGWTEAMQLMGEGDKWKLYIPYNLAYGEKGTGPIPAFSPLIFEIEIHKVLSGGKPIANARKLFQNSILVNSNKLSLKSENQQQSEPIIKKQNHDENINKKDKLNKNIRRNNNNNNNNRGILHDSTKVHFPHVLGMSSTQAEAAIKELNPNVKVSFVNEGSMVTMDFREDRVRVYLDKEGKVSRTPRVG